MILIRLNEIKLNIKKCCLMQIIILFLFQLNVYGIDKNTEITIPQKVLQFANAQGFEHVEQLSYLKKYHGYDVYIARKEDIFMFILKKRYIIKEATPKDYCNIFYFDEIAPLSCRLKYKLKYKDFHPINKGEYYRKTK